MGARKKIALIYDYSEGWIAGSYYVANVLKAVNELPDKEKVHFVILNQSGTGWDLLKEIHYPYIDLVGVHEGGGFFPNLIRRLSKKLLGRDYYLRYKLKDVKDILNGWNYFSFIPRHFFWVHDFQEFRMPQFFSPEEAAQRSALPKAVAKMPDATLILSSRDALNDFSTFFPNHKCKTRIVQFASALPDTSGINFETERTKYNIKTPYFICSNQFWQHKNHITVMRAICILKERRQDFQVVFTGKNYDHRNKGYFDSIREFVSTNGLDRWVNFLGFIDRKVQLKLAENAISYIQPSLFEGWSTTVEDAKCMNQLILLSDIPVHREQINYNVRFFNPYIPEELAKGMEAMMNHEIIKEQRDYGKNIHLFGEKFLEVFSNL